MKNKLVLLLIIVFFFVFCCQFNFKNVKADSLSDNIEKQLEELDFSSLEDVFNDISNESFIYNIKQLLNGNYYFTFENVLSILLNGIKQIINNYLPIFASILAVVLFSYMINKLKGNFAKSSVSKLVNLIYILLISGILLASFFNMFNNIKIIIENIAKINEIMSPIMLTLIVASGGSVSANIFSTSTNIFTFIIISVIENIILPLIIVLTILSTISNYSADLKLDNFNNCISSIIKWILGLFIALFGIVYSINGISSGVYDGISIKATKYAISNSIPIVGSLLKDGFDLIIAGSILIKNSVGVVIIFLMFLYVLSPIMEICVFSLFLKFSSGITDLIDEKNFSNFFNGISKSLLYLNAVLISVLLVSFVNIILLIISANTFI